MTSKVSMLAVLALAFGPAVSSDALGDEATKGYALHMAVLAQDAEEVARLLGEGAPVNHSGLGEMAPLHLAAARGCEEGARLLLENGAEANARERFGWTPLHLAAANGHRDVALLLLDAGADVNAPCARGGLTPLHRAAFNGHPEVVELLLQRGAEVDAMSKGGHIADWMGPGEMTPLHWAAAGHSEGNVRAVELLIAAGADVNHHDDRRGRGMTALHWAALAENPATIATLMKAGASPDAQEDRGQTPRDFAARAPAEVRRLLAPDED